MGPLCVRQRSQGVESRRTHAHHPVLQGEAEAQRGSLRVGRAGRKAAAPSSALSASALCFAAVLPPKASLAPSPTWVTHAHTFHRAPGLQRRLALTTWMAFILGGPPTPPHCGGSNLRTLDGVVYPQGVPGPYSTGSSGPTGTKEGASSLWPVQLRRPPGRHLRSRQAAVPAPASELFHDGKQPEVAALIPELP